MVAVRRLVGIVAVVALVVSAPTAVAQDDWPDSEDGAPEVGEGAHEGTVGSADDEDELKIPVQRGDTVTLTLEKPIRRDTRLRVEWPGNQRGVTVADESADQLQRKVTVEENGFVQVEVSSDTADQGPEDWTLRVDRNEGADEWRDAEDTASEVGTGIHAGSVTSPDDEDELKIPVEQGDTVNLTLFKPIRKDVRFRVEWPGNQRGVTIADESADRLQRKVTVEENGFVQIEITSDTVRTGSEEWRLEVSRQRAADRWRDSEDTASEVQHGTHTGAVTSPDDEDELSLPVRKGDTATLRLTKTAGADVRFRVEWPGNQRGVTVADESAEQLERKVTVEENGFVQVEITSDTVRTGSEDWRLDIQRRRDVDRWRDSEATAARVESGTHDGHVHSRDDEDELKYPVERGETVALELAKNSGTDVRFRVEWPGNQRGVTVADEGARRLSREVTAEENGFVQIEITSDTVRTGEEPWSLGLNAEPNDPEESTATPTPEPPATGTPTPDRQTPTPDQQTPTPERRTPADTETATRTRPPTPTAYETAAPETPTPSSTPGARGAETPVTASPPPEDGEGTPADDTATATVPEDEGTGTARDSDDDGVPNSEDYAPRDPDVQAESDLDEREPTASGGMPGFGPAAVALSLLAGGLLAHRRH